MLLPITEQLACAQRELRLRQRVYPRWVAEGKMDEVKLQRELSGMEAIVETLAALCRQEEAKVQPSLFGEDTHA